jgi:hypothetical protein
MEAEPPEAEPPKRHKALPLRESGLGVASLILGILSVSFIVWNRSVIWFHVNPWDAWEWRVGLLISAKVVILIGLLSSIIGLSLGIAAVIQAIRAKKLAYIGLCINVILAALLVHRFMQLPQ